MSHTKLEFDAYVTRLEAERDRLVAQRDALLEFVQWMARQRCEEALAITKPADYDPKCDCSTCWARKALRAAIADVEREG